ncbi:1-deoxy-D-xylulose-5-phosphate synthase [Capnocytophaga cynodegmi]|uniref:1-deoxy-D-xylulose-5-phosphate synthase n=1 Tax=Capnocytophaga cynodegmi TaxID=28189 RepID=A0A0B7HEY6_9FLAO|nr:1-deoxy-D-xylulose-5-phosphate synthase [Capnocytophaga cynodegmi]CEN38276.1 1-deoxy-D-xylulose-5-phosphate synthase [Capnocytophaga cynodegmi]CEN38564.1 1-deoxy-D-xylulose-5-phosphate synthase [Capnocytophaga cynodegmi]
MFLSDINSPDDLRKIPKEELPSLAREVREFIIDVVSEKGGHLGASLGVVELTIALHYVFNTPDDKLVWDVGHQAYAHKILTNRKKQFQTNREFGGISGFPKIDESLYDAFGTGHSSTSISAILGMAIASTLQGNPHRNHIAVIGDASIVSGMAFEAMNHAGTTQANLLIILNDNAIGIDPSVGALKDYFAKMKSEKGENETFFNNLNIKYNGVIDGHNLTELIDAFDILKNEQGVKVLHVITTKGKGLEKAEKEQITYHAPRRFDKITGEQLSEDSSLPAKYQDIFGLTINELAQENQKIVAITPAMPSGSSLTFMQKSFPERVFDVGIAEQHAVTFSAGLALEGFIPFCVVYSTFLQRAYDQLIHDVALQNIPVIFCIDRAGLVGEDGPTHHGVFDMAFLRPIPNLVIASPRNASQLRNLLYTAQLGVNFPFVIRYPRGRCNEMDWQQPFQEIKIGTAEQLKEGSKYAILSIGNISDNVTKAIHLLKNPEDYAHFDIRFLKPLDESLLHTIFATYKIIFTVEEGSEKGGLGSAIAEFASKNGYNKPLKIIGIPDQFIPHGSINELQKTIALDHISISEILNNKDI